MRTDVEEWTPSRCFEYARAELGVGTWDEAISGDEDYYSWTRKQAGMLGRMMKARRITPAEFVLCVDYCRANKFSPDTVQGVMSVYSRARAWDQERQRSLPPTSLLDLQVVLEIEEGFNDDQTPIWRDRFLRASTRVMGEVVAEWRVARGLPE